MLKLRDSTKRHIEKNLGISIDELKRMSHKEYDNFIEKKIGKKLKYK